MGRLPNEDESCLADSVDQRVEIALTVYRPGETLDFLQLMPRRFHESGVPLLSGRQTRLRMQRLRGRDRGY